MNTQKNDVKSMGMFIGSMLIFGTIGIFRRYIPLSSALLACYRGACGGLFLLLFVLLTKKKGKGKIPPKTILALVITGALMGLNWLLLFEAFNYTTVATATLCYYMQPTIVVLLSPMIFSEKLTVKKGTCALVAVIGMVFVSGIVENGVPALGEMKGILLGLGAAALYASVVIMNKKNPGLDAYQKTIIQLFAAALVLIPYLAVSEDFSSIHLDGMAVLMLVIVGLVHTGVAYALYFGSMDGIRAQSIAIFSYLDPIAALILSALILHERMTIFGIIGAVLILGAAFISEQS